MSGAEQLAKRVKIYRDDFGVPHVVAESDVAAIFGSAFAQCEDNFSAIETAYLRVLGRLAEKEGPRAFWSDVIVRALELPRLSQEEYRLADSKTVAMCDAFAAGSNLYVDTRKVRSAVGRFLPWHVLALHRFLHLTAFWALGIEPGEIADALNWIDAQYGRAPIKERPVVGDSGASLACAIGPTKSARGAAMLLSVSHVQFGSLYELHLRSEEGLNFAGTGFWGMPLPMMGINSQLGWSLTASRPAVADLYAEAFESGERQRRYRYGKARKRAMDWKEILLIRNATEMTRRNVHFRKTHHGPIVGMRCGVPLAVRIAQISEGGLMQQLLAMAKSGSLRAFKAAVGRRALISHNIMYADARGNIFYIYNGALPRRRWRTICGVILDGSDTAVDWRGYHPISELPQLRNPPSGFLQNCNSSPFSATIGRTPDPNRFPAYMKNEPDTPQARIVRSIASSVSRFSMDDLVALAFDTKAYRAPEIITAIGAEWDALHQQQPKRARKIGRAVSLLREWNCESTADSIAMTVLVAWMEESGRLNTGMAGEWPTIVALEAALEKLKRRWGKWNVPWGRVNRLQRPRTPGGYTDQAPSFPIAGGPPEAGIAFTFEAAEVPGQIRRYGSFGSAHILVAEFGRKTEARSISVFGQSSDWNSPHFFDQAKSYRSGKLKRFSLDIPEIGANCTRCYFPS